MHKTGLAPRTTRGFSHNTRRDEQQEPGLLSLLRKLLGASSLTVHAEGMHHMRRDALGVALVRELLEMRMFSSAADRRPSILTTTTTTLRSRSQAPLAVPSSASTAACLRLIFSLLLIKRSVRSAIVAVGKWSGASHVEPALGQWCAGCFGYIPTHLALSPIPLSAQGRGVGKGRWVGTMGTHFLAWSSAVTWPRSGQERWRSGVRGRGGVVGRFMVLSEFSFLTLSRFVRWAFPMRFKRILSRSCL